jgi:RNase P/RNase MRP subunit p29
MKNIEQLMAEADPVKTLSQTGSIRMLKRLTPDAVAPAAPTAPVAPVPAPTPAVSAPAPASAPAVIVPPKATEAASPWPSFAAKDVPAASEPNKTEPIPPVEAKKPETPEPAAATAPTAVPVTAPALQLPRSVARETAFLPRQAMISATPPANRPPPPALPPMISIGSIGKRKAKLADVARIILPPKREETGPLPSHPAPIAAGSPTPTVNPSAIVAPATARLPIRPLPKLVLSQTFPSPVSDSPFMERGPAKAAPPETSPAPEAKIEKPTPTEPIAKATEPEPKPAEAKSPEPEKPKAPEPTAPLRPAEVRPVAPTASPSLKTETVPIIVPPAFTFVPKTDFEAPKLDPSLVFDPTSMPEKAEPVNGTAQPTFETMPRLDPEAHKTTTQEILPKLDPEAHKAPPPVEPAIETSEPEPATVTSTEIEPAVAPGTREFHLTNGERVAGVVLSETPDTLYVQHPSLGVLTIPRDEIATRLVEIILINGDRIVGNIMAETADVLYVRHASLGMLSVPKGQRSRRVVEAILKNGDRILGEVLTETETFTVIKSASLGTVTVPHDKVSMLNRKIEQIEMKALPGGAPPALPG